ncbi:acyl-CoA thioesterase [Pseudonocardia sp. GCM10023141]|uniref:acyl-CoA thioesterase n=1 Tax=Pseudonocardia sp. GCM10023141 TaxID=3252653 RepID=UPI00360F1FDA
MSRTAADAALEAAGALQTLVEKALVLTERAPDTFSGGAGPAAFDRLYGGLIAAQALRAAGGTVVAPMVPQSLHVHFLRLGSPDAELLLSVERVRDTRRGATRLVRAEQDGRLVALATAAFQVPQPGIEHGRTTLSAPDPEELPTRTASLQARFGDALPPNARAVWPIDIRHIDRAPWTIGGSTEPRNRMWVRAAAALPADPLLQACVFAYASDLTMFEPVIYPHEHDARPLSWEAMIHGEVRGGSLDHTIWFHRPFRVDEWLLHEHVSTVAAESRGLTTGQYRTPDGTLVASVAQEVAVLHDPRPEGPP